MAAAEGAWAESGAAAGAAELLAADGEAAADADGDDECDTKEKEGAGDAAAAPGDAAAVEAACRLGGGGWRCSAANGNAADSSAAEDRSGDALLILSRVGLACAFGVNAADEAEKRSEAAAGKAKQQQAKQQQARQKFALDPHSLLHSHLHSTNTHAHRHNTKSDSTHSHEHTEGHGGVSGVGMRRHCVRRASARLLSSSLFRACSAASSDLLPESHRYG